MMGRRTVLLFSLALLGFQEEPGTLIEKLRSDRIEEREEAARALVRAGKEVIPLLERAAKDPDAEMAARAGRILRVRRVLDGLTPRFRRLMPRAEERLMAGKDSVVTEIFLEAVGDQGPAGLRRDDLAALVGPAIFSAETSKAKVKVCDE